STRVAGLVAGCVLALSSMGASAAPLALSYSGTFNNLTGPVFGTTTNYEFSTSFFIESTASPVDTLVSGATTFYGYGADAISGFAATFGDHTFTELLTSVIAPGHAAAIYFDAPLTSGNVSNFFVRALDGAGSLSLGSLNCDEGTCEYTAYGLAQQAAGGVSAAYDTALTVTVPVSPPVPEPETWALMFAGLGLVGAAARRRAAGRTATA
ncbi:MAG: PEPxxWA-CTERM sorting domain-containing protein, partial [Rhizobacter sp.]